MSLFRTAFLTASLATLCASPSLLASPRAPTPAPEPSPAPQPAPVHPTVTQAALDALGAIDIQSCKSGRLPSMSSTAKVVFASSGIVEYVTFVDGSPFLQPAHATLSTCVKARLHKARISPPGQLLAVQFPFTLK